MGNKKIKKARILVIILMLISLDIAPILMKATEIENSTEEPVTEEVHEDSDDTNKNTEELEEELDEELDEELEEDLEEELEEEQESEIETTSLEPQSDDKYVMATDEDFEFVKVSQQSYGYEVGGVLGHFRYVGDDEYVEIPHKIQGHPMTRYTRLFRGASKTLKGVKSTNLNIINTAEMFEDSRNKGLDISELDTRNVTNFRGMFYNTKIEEINIDKLNTENATSMWNMFRDSEIKDYNLSNLDTSNVISMEGMFRGVQVEDVDISMLDTGKVQNMSLMFTESKVKRVNLGSIDVGRVSNMGMMFSGSDIEEIQVGELNPRRLTNINGMFKGVQMDRLSMEWVNTESVRTMEQIFEGATIKELDLTEMETESVTSMVRVFKDASIKQLKIEGIDTTNVNNMNKMFEGYKGREVELRNFNTSRVENMGRMFAEATIYELDLRNFDTHKVEIMDSMFEGANVESINLYGFNTSRVTDMSSMFRGTTATDIKVPTFDTRYVIRMSNMFEGVKVEELDISGFDLGRVSLLDNMFQGSYIGNLKVRTIRDKEKVVNSGEITNIRSIEELYREAEDNDFIGTINSSFRYIGEDEYVEVPREIRGVRVTSYQEMFKDTGVRGVITDSKYITDMSRMFKGSTAQEIDITGIDLGNVKTLEGMFKGSKAKNIRLGEYETKKLENTKDMFKETELGNIDLSSFDFSKVLNKEGMFEGTKATSGYGRTKEDIDIISKNTNKPKDLKFELWSLVATHGEGWTNKEVKVKVKARAEGSGVYTLERVEEGGRNLLLNSGKVVRATNNEFITYADLAPIFDRYGTDREYSLSLDLKHGGSPSSGNIIVYMQNGSGTKYRFVQTTVRATKNYKRFKFEGLKPVMTNGSETRSMLAFMGSYGTGIYPIITNVKVEFGDKATDWTPAPEDNPPTGDGENTYIIQDNGHYVFKVTDRKGNVKYLTHTVSNIDKINPELEVTPSTTGWTSNDVTLDVTATDDLSGIDYIELPDGKKVKSEEAEYVAKENKTYTFKAVDKAGNEEVITHKVDNIDRSRPDLKAKVENPEWTRDTVDIRVTSGKSDSGLKDIIMKDSHLEGRNLFSREKGDRGFVAGDGQLRTPDADNWDSGYINLKELDLDNNTLYYTADVTVDNPKELYRNLWTGVGLYDKDKKFIQRVVYNEPGVENGTKQVRLYNISNLLNEEHHYIRVGSRYLEEGKAKLELVSNEVKETDLFEKGGLSVGYVQRNSGSITEPDAKNMTSNYINVEDIKKEEIEYHIEVTVDKGEGLNRSWTGLGLYDKNKEFIKRVEYIEPSVPVGTKQKLSYKIGEHLQDEEVKYIRVGSRYLEEGKATIKVGKEATPWTPAPEDIKLDGLTKVYPVSVNGRYVFEAEHNNGIKTETSVNVTNIDREPPKMTVKNNPTDWTEEDEVELEITATDEKSGLKSVTVDGKKETYDGDKSGTVNYKVSKNGEYKVILEDMLGNKTTETIVVDKLMVHLYFYVIDEEGKPIEGAEYELLRDGIVHTSATSDKDGLVDFGKVPATGKYTVRLINNKEGGNNQGEIEINPGKDDGTIPEITVHERGDTLPATGTKDVMVIVLIITSIIITGIIINLRKGKMRN